MINTIWRIFLWMFVLNFLLTIIFMILYLWIDCDIYIKIWITNALLCVIDLMVVLVLTQI